MALPPVSEQAAILSALEHKSAALDDLITGAQGMIALMRERRTALISAAVTGKIDVRGWKAPDSEVEAEVA